MKLPVSGNNSSIIAFLAYLLIVLFVLAGCGKKGPPVPPPEEIPPPVTDLTSESNGQTITFSWSVPIGETAEQLNGFKLFRSKKQLLESDCKDCPVVFKLIADIPVEVDNDEESENRKVVYYEMLESPDNNEIAQVTIPQTDDEQKSDTASPESDDQKDDYTITPKSIIFYKYKVVGYTEYGVLSPDSNVVRVELPADDAETIPLESIQQ